MNLWPSTLPQYALRAGYSDSPKMPRASFETDAGPAIERPKGTMHMSIISCSFRMTAQQLTTFERFVDSDLVRATQEFLIPHPRTREQVRAKLTGNPPYRTSPAAGIHWQVAIEILVLGA